MEGAQEQGFGGPIHHTEAPIINMLPHLNIVFFALDTEHFSRVLRGTTGSQERAPLGETTGRSGSAERQSDLVEQSTFSSMYLRVFFRSFTNVQCVKDSLHAEVPRECGEGSVGIGWIELRADSSPIATPQPCTWRRDNYCAPGGRAGTSLP